MHRRLLQLPLVTLVLAALACSTLNLAGPTPTAALTLAPASPTSAAPTPVATTPAPTASAIAASPTPAATSTPAPTTKPTASPTISLSVGVNLSNSGKADLPRLAFDAQGTLHLAWNDTSSRPSGDDFDRQLPANGNWSPAENLTADLQLVYGDLSLRRDANGPVCAFFSAAKVSGNPFTIGLYQRCLAGGAWSSAAKLPVSKLPGVTLSGYSVVHAADGTAHALYAVSTNGGVYFDNTQLSGTGSAAGPVLAVDKAGGYHAAWVSLGGPFSVQYRFSGDQGKTWQPVQTLSTDQNAPSGSPVRLMADDVGNVHLLWGGTGVTYRLWTTSGGWGPAVAVAGTSNAPNPDLAVDGQGLARAVWSIHLVGLFEAVQAADGTWSAPRLLSSVESGEPQVAVDAQGGSHIAWLTNKDVFYLRLP